MLPEKMIIPNEDDVYEVAVLVVIPSEVDGEENRQQLLILNLSSDNGNTMEIIREWALNHYTKDNPYLSVHITKMDDSYIFAYLIEISPGKMHQASMHSYYDKSFDDFAEEVIEEMEQDVEVDDVEKIEEYAVEKVRCQKIIPDIKKHDLSVFIPALDTTDKQMDINTLLDSPVFSYISKSSKSKNEVETLTIYPQPPFEGGVTVTTDDYKCLEENTYLNDVIIDFYLTYIQWNKLSFYDWQRTHIFSSYFFTQLSRSYVGNNEEGKTEDERRHTGVRRWTKNVNIFTKDFVIIPINEDSHWYLVIICFANLVSNPDTRKLDFCTKIFPVVESQRPCLLVFDSLGSEDKFHVANILRAYLREEYLTKMNEKKDFNELTLKTVHMKVPLQTNMFDCGLYLLQYVEHFFKDPIRDYWLPIKDLSEWFEYAAIVQKRVKIAKVIKKLAAEFNKGKNFNLPKIQFPQYGEFVTNRNPDRFRDLFYIKQCKTYSKITPYIKPFKSVVSPSESMQDESKNFERKYIEFGSSSWITNESNYLKNFDSFSSISW